MKCVFTAYPGMTTKTTNHFRVRPITDWSCIKLPMQTKIIFDKTDTTEVANIVVSKRMNITSRNTQHI